MAGNKRRTTIWLTPNTMEALDEMVIKYNCRSKLIEQALMFYDGYVRSTQKNEYLPIALSSALNGIVKISEDRIAKVIF